MINEKYYNDIKNFPLQFKEGIDIAKNIQVDGTFSYVHVCGMGGSSSYIELINDFLESKRSTIKLTFNRSYSLPTLKRDTLYIVSSHSGNTEETLACLDEIEKKNLPFCVITSGGKLLERAKKNNNPILLIPRDVQPRLSAGYFIGAIIKLMSNCGLIDHFDDDLSCIGNEIHGFLDENRSKELASQLVNKVPIVYGTDNNSSLARVTKIKFNENSKVQSFHNTFPEVNHNEMVGFTNMKMNPHFIIFQSKYTTEKNHRRIEIFTDLMRNKNIPVTILHMQGKDTFTEMMNMYYFMDHVTYYLAQEYGVDPEPVEMVEEFKALL